MQYTNYAHAVWNTFDSIHWIIHRFWVFEQSVVITRLRKNENFSEIRVEIELFKRAYNVNTLNDHSVQYTRAPMCFYVGQCNHRDNSIRLTSACSCALCGGANGSTDLSLQHIYQSWHCVAVHVCALHEKKLDYLHSKLLSFTLCVCAQVTFACWNINNTHVSSMSHELFFFLAGIVEWTRLSITISNFL